MSAKTHCICLTYLLFCMQGGNPGAVLAVWCFIVPDKGVLAEAAGVLRTLFREKYEGAAPTGLKPGPGQVLTPEDFLLLQKEMGKSKVVVLEQKRGQVVFVPPGWAHCVYNCEPCVKLAHDRLIPERFPLYAEAWCEAGCSETMVAATDHKDYMSYIRTAIRQIAL